MEKSYRVIQRPMRDPLGEGVVWSARENAVYRVDIPWQALQRLSPGAGVLGAGGWLGWGYG